MLLCIDVGNTETKLGAFDASGEMVGTWRVTTARRRTADEYGVLFAAFFSTSRFPIDGVEAIVGVAHAQDEALGRRIAAVDIGVGKSVGALGAVAVDGAHFSDAR